VALLAGVDGCRAGWVAAIADTAGGPLRLEIFPSAAVLVDALAGAALIGVDIPIGLTEAGPRDCDVAARRLLGRPRASSVFPAPIRPILHAATRAEANLRHRAADGRGFGVHAWNIVPKIREWDALLQARPALRARVFEVHPEVAFAALNGGAAIAAPKRGREGHAVRRRVLRRVYGTKTIAAALAALPSRLAQRDDVLDALVVLWSAARIYLGEGVSLPAPQETDAAGLPMAIWY
jgi:predicted RNase H-like nuclease